MRLAIASLVFAVACAAALGVSLSAAPDEKQKMIAPGKLALAGWPMRCGAVPTLISNTFWDYGGSHRGMIILNPGKLDKLPTTVQLYIYEHECGHQMRGSDETLADCYAVQRGRQAGWLKREGVEEICGFFRAHPSDSVHPPGPARCRAMTQCFESAKPVRAGR